MTEDELFAALERELTQCELGREGRGHGVEASWVFRFRCLTAECASDPRGPAEQSLWVCERCLRLVNQHGLDCMRCGEFYRSDGWAWAKATGSWRLVGP